MEGAGPSMPTIAVAAKEVKAVALRVAQHVPELLGSAQGVAFARALSSTAAQSVDGVGTQLHWLFVSLKQFRVVSSDYLCRSWVERVSSPDSAQTLLDLAGELEEAICWDDAATWGAAPRPDPSDQELELVLSSDDDDEGSEGDHGAELVVVVSDDEDVAVVEASEDGPAAGKEAGAALSIDDQGEVAHSPSAADSRDAQLAKLQQKVKDLQKQVQTLTAANTTLKVSAFPPPRLLYMFSLPPGLH